MNLKYHNKSLELIGSQPQFSDDAYPELPASIDEWYSRFNGLKLLEKYSNQDVPLSPPKFEVSWHNDKELVIFMYENQGVFWWAFEKCDNEDPPIYVNEDPPSDNWVLCCNKFSDFVFTRIFDFYHWYEDNLFTLATGKSIKRDRLGIVTSEYIQHPVTQGGYSKAQYRFSLNDQKITIHDHGSNYGWYLSADSPSGVRNLLEKFSGLYEGYFPEINDPPSTIAKVETHPPY
jgi:hypothetical protein